MSCRIVKNQTADFDITLRHTQKFSLSTSRATICSPLLSLLWLPSACGHNTAQRPCPTLCTAARTSNRPAGSSPSFFPTSGWPLKVSRMGRKSMLRGRWPSSGLTLPERAEVESVPNTKAQLHMRFLIRRSLGIITADKLAMIRFYLSLHKSLKIRRFNSRSFWNIFQHFPTMNPLSRIKIYRNSDAFALPMYSSKYFLHPWARREDPGSDKGIRLHCGPPKRGPADGGAGHTVLLPTPWGGLLPCAAAQYDQVTWAKVPLVPIELRLTDVYVQRTGAGLGSGQKGGCLSLEKHAWSLWCH